MTSTYPLEDRHQLPLLFCNFAVSNLSAGHVVHLTFPVSTGHLVEAVAKRIHQCANSETPVQKCGPDLKTDLSRTKKKKTNRDDDEEENRFI